MPTSRQPSPQVKVNTKQAAEETSDKLLDYLTYIGLFVLVVYGLTIGYDQAAPFFGLPHADPTVFGGALLFVRLVVHEIRTLISRP